MLKTILLAVVQGLTEFLPISSSGHLVIFEHLLDVKRPGLVLEVALHLGTVFAVVAVYRQKIRELVRHSIRALGERSLSENPNAKFTVAVIVATIPTALMGVAFERYIEGMFESLLVVGVALIVTGVVLLTTKWARESEAAASDIGPMRAILIGITQGLAMIPGISRSGSTISCGLLLGVNRESAAMFSFILSLPAVLGAAAWKCRDAVGSEVDWLALGIGVIVSFVVGCLALKLLLRFVKRGKLHLFSYYCFSVGVLAILAWVLFISR